MFPSNSKQLQVCAKENNESWIKYKLAINTAVHPMPMIDILLILPFKSSLEVAQT